MRDLPRWVMQTWFLLSFLLHTLFFLSSLVTRSTAQSGPSSWTKTPFNAPALPLAVRSPYLNTWLAQGNTPDPLCTLWPNLWTIGQVTGWFSLVVVDGEAYRIMGRTQLTNLTTANQTTAEFTATRTSFIFTAGPMQINATFLSPIEPKDLVRQSLPFSYYTMSATSTDGKAHSLRMYSDISGEFITGDDSQLAVWESSDDENYIILSMTLQTPQKYTEIANHAQDAVEYYAFKKLSGTITSWAITDHLVNRPNAGNGTNLGNVQDTPPRPVSTRWPTLGIAVDWESVQTTPEPAVWAIGLIRNPSIQYRSVSGTEDRYPYFLTVWSDGTTATMAFLDDYSRAAAVASAFDTQIRNDGNAVSSDYADMLALSARQAMGALDITLAGSGSGDWNISDTKVFMKNLGAAGSDASGTTTSVNTVDTLYAAFPVFLYLNPELGGYLLAPLLEYQDSSAYILTYAARNIGLSYPNATGDDLSDAHDYGIEESADMLIMTLAYSQRSGNGTFISRHYTLLRRWADYLVNNTLTPINQKSADYSTDTEVSNNEQTNVALKGIIGIADMAKIVEVASVQSDQEKYNSTATSYIQQWQTMSLAEDNTHIKFIANDTDTNGLIYNLYADKLLQLDFVPDQVYEVATVFYNNVASQPQYGLPLNNVDSDRTAAHWMMYSASIVTNTATRDHMIGQVHDYAASTHNNTPWPVLYNPSSAVSELDDHGKASPAIGGIFSILALNTTVQASINIPQEGSTIPAGASSQSSSKSNKGAIAGGIVGGIIGAALIGFGVFFCMRRRRNRNSQERYDTRVDPMTTTTTSPTSYSTVPRNVPGLRDGVKLEPFPYGGDRSLDSRAHLNSQPDSGGVVYGPHDKTGTTRDARGSAHSPGEGDGVGLSAYQGGSSTTSGSGGGSSSQRVPGLGSSGTLNDGTAPQQVMLARQTMVNEELRSEMENLRRDFERIREERRAAGHTNLDEAPPSYDGPV